MREMILSVEGGELGGTLATPPGSHGLVIFAHGSGSSRHSPRNRFVAKSLNECGFATLLMDLLTDEEESIDSTTASLRFDISLLARRMVLATAWCKHEKPLKSLPVGYFGASTGAGAALVAAAGRSDIAAIVSRGGRPDLAGAALGDVEAPTLLIVGERDTVVADLNRQAASQMSGHCEIAIVPGAGHLFEESGKLEYVARLAREWFVRYLAPR
jgi:putative phosphoribosyl transferase